mmetsp:Transcript_16254/g.36564  ORF Transcript_16254/g.36564 Transcript_16254/m.36564 type:complete len:467 (-) Transcript_16254:25-1425(-)
MITQMKMISLEMTPYIKALKRTHYFLRISKAMSCEQGENLDSAIGPFDTNSSVLDSMQESSMESSMQRYMGKYKESSANKLIASCNNKPTKNSPKKSIENSAERSIEDNSAEKAIEKSMETSLESLYSVLSLVRNKFSNQSSNHDIDEIVINSLLINKNEQISSEEMNLSFGCGRLTCYCPTTDGKNLFDTVEKSGDFQHQSLSEKERKVTMEINDKDEIESFGLKGEKIVMDIYNKNEVGSSSLKTGNIFMESVDKNGDKVVLKVKDINEISTSGKRGDEVLMEVDSKDGVNYLSLSFNESGFSMNEDRENKEIRKDRSSAVNYNSGRMITKNSLPCKDKKKNEIKRMNSPRTAPKKYVIPKMGLHKNNAKKVKRAELMNFHPMNYEKQKDRLGSILYSDKNIHIPKNTNTHYDCCDDKKISDDIKYHSGDTCSTDDDPINYLLGHETKVHQNYWSTEQESHDLL